MSDIIKIFGVGILVAVCDLLLAEAGKKDIALAVGIMGVIVVLIIVVGKIKLLFQEVTSIFGL